MIVLGADTHKRSHTVAAVAAPTGELLAAIERDGLRSVADVARATGASTGYGGWRPSVEQMLAGQP